MFKQRINESLTGSHRNMLGYIGPSTFLITLLIKEKPLVRLRFGQFSTMHSDLQVGKTPNFTNILKPFLKVLVHCCTIFES